MGDFRRYRRIVVCGDLYQGTTVYCVLTERYMAEQKTFDNITEAIFQCLKQTSAKKLGTVYLPPDACQGIATTQTIVGEIVVRFDLDQPSNRLTYEIQKKPVMVSAKQIWENIEAAISACGK